MDLSPSSNNSLDANGDRRRMLKLSFQQQQAQAQQKLQADALKEQGVPVPEKTKLVD